MKLKFYIKNKKRVYTLKTQHNNKPTNEAHYKFIKLKSPTESKQTQS